MLMHSNCRHGCSLPSEQLEDLHKKLKYMSIIPNCIAVLQEHTGVRRLDFLPYHFLLASIGEGGVLRYQVRSLIKQPQGS